MDQICQRSSSGGSRALQVLLLFLNSIYLLIKQNILQIKHTPAYQNLVNIHLYRASDGSLTAY